MKSAFELILRTKQLHSFHSAVLHTGKLVHIIFFFVVSNFLRLLHSERDGSLCPLGIAFFPMFFVPGTAKGGLKTEHAEHNSANSPVKRINESCRDWFFYCRELNFSVVDLQVVTPPASAFFRVNFVAFPFPFSPSFSDSLSSGSFLKKFF